MSMMRFVIVLLNEYMNMNEYYIDCYCLYVWKYATNEICDEHEQSVRLLKECIMLRDRPIISTLPNVTVICLLRLTLNKFLLNYVRRVRIRVTVWRPSGRAPRRRTGPRHVVNLYGALEPYGTDQQCRPKNVLRPAGHVSFILKYVGGYEMILIDSQ